MKNEEFKEGIDFYFDESGLMVLTKDFHLKRGFCCGNGCRQCPFDYENVSENRRKELLLKSKKATDIKINFALQNKNND
jgi:hypothetical protein